MSILKTNKSFDPQTNWWFVTRLAELKHFADCMQPLHEEYVNPKELIEKLEWAWNELLNRTPLVQEELNKGLNKRIDQLLKEKADLEVIIIQLNSQMTKRLTLEDSMLRCIQELERDLHSLRGTSRDSQKEPIK